MTFCHIIVLIAIRVMKMSTLTKCLYFLLCNIVLCVELAINCKRKKGKKEILMPRIKRGLNEIMSTTIIIFNGNLA